MGSRQLRAARLLLLLMLPLLQVVSARLLEMENSGEDASDEWRKSDEADSFNAEKQSPADEDDSAEPEVQLEATKKQWIKELTANVESTMESADLIEKIHRRTSGSGLRHLKAACRALCPRCVCGVILMPSFPTGHAGKPKSKLPPVNPTIPAAKSDSKPKVKKLAKPEKLPAKTTVKPAETTTPPAVIKKETGKKAKKWLLGMKNQESQLSDFQLNEDVSGSVYKREVGDHDPLSQSGDAQSSFSID